MFFTPCIVINWLLEAVTEAAESLAFGERNLTFHAPLRPVQISNERNGRSKALVGREINI
jgi:hypothetical protein